jgi:hypothetical protein
MGKQDLVEAGTVKLYDRDIIWVVVSIWEGGGGPRCSRGCVMHEASVMVTTSPCSEAGGDGVGALIDVALLVQRGRAEMASPLTGQPGKETVWAS